MRRIWKWDTRGLGAREKEKQGEKEKQEFSTVSWWVPSSIVQLFTQPDVEREKKAIPLGFSFLFYSVRFFISKLRAQPFSFSLRLCLLLRLPPVLHPFFASFIAHWWAASRPLSGFGSFNGIPCFALCNYVINCKSSSHTPRTQWIRSFVRARLFLFFPITRVCWTDICIILQCTIPCTISQLF